MLALAALAHTAAWAQDGTSSGLLINNDGGAACREYAGAAQASDHDDADICGGVDRAGQLNRALFHGRDGAARVDSLTLDGELYVDSGRLGPSGRSGGYNMAVGSQATLDATQGNNSIAIGSAQTSDDDGASSRATIAAGNRAVAIGSGARANSDNGIALGTNAVAAGTGSRQGSVAIGNQARADGDGSLALGATANAGGLMSTAIGHGSVATGTSSISIGGNARGTGAIALGGGTTQDDYAQAFGSGATALKRMAWAQGFNAAAKGQHSMALGAYSEASADYTLALGSFAKATGNGAWDGAGTALGAYSRAAAQGTAIGNAATAAGQQGTAVGSYATAKGAGSMALGARAEASASNSVALGQGANATRDNAVSLGSETSRAGADGKTIAAFTRQLVNLSAGTQDTDAVNVGQLKPVINALGGGASFDAATGKVLAPVYRVRGGTQDNVGDALAALDAGIDAGKVHFVSIDGSDQEGNYNNDGATGKDSIAIGAGAQAKGRNDIHMGVGAGEGGVATNSNNVGVGTGAGARVKGEYNAGLGAWAGQYVEGNYNAAVGIAGGQVKGDSNSAMGNSAGMLVTGNANSAIGAAAGALLTGHYNVASGTATGLGVQGNHNVASGSAAGMLIKGDGNVALGESAGTGYRIELDDVGMKITDRDGKVYTNFAELPAPKALNNTVAVGNRAITDADDAVAIGKDALSSHAGSVALGAGSIADGKTLAQEAYLVGGTAKGEVNIGDRRLTGVAAGATDTDAVNVAQLKQVVASSTVDAVVYDSAAHDRLTLGGVSASAPVALTNVKKGEVSATSTDAVNGAQLYEATQALEAGKGRYVSINDGGVARGNHDNDGATGEDAIAIGVDASAGAKGATALGAGATASAEGAVALGAGSVADQANTVSVGSEGNERRITHVADGVEDTDAANVGQLKKAGIVDPNGETRDVLTYDSGSNRAQVTLGGGAGGTVITNLAEGRVAIGSRDAVNGGQLASIRDDLQNQIKNVDNRVTQIENNGTGGNNQSPGFVADGSEDQPATTPNGSGGTASGAGAVASGNHGTANGAGAVASGNNSTALGAGSQATAENSVALGANSVADRANTVSVGSEGAPRQITNVAAGTAPTDAVNVAQLHDGLQEVKDWSRLYTDGRFDSLNRDINRVGQRADAGVASAMAMASLPQAYLPGANMAGAAISSFRGEASIAIGVSTISEDGRWVYKLNATGNTRGDVGAGMGVGLQW